MVDHASRLWHYDIRWLVASVVAVSVEPAESAVFVPVAAVVELQKDRWLCPEDSICQARSTSNFPQEEVTAVQVCLAYML